MDFRGKNIDLVGRLKLWFGISLAFIVVGLVALTAFGLNLGIDFKGGGQVQYRIPVAQRPTGGNDVALLNSVREGLEAKNLRGTKLQVAGGDTLIVQTGARSDGELRGQERTISQTLAGVWKVPVDAPALKPIGRELVGPVIGEELRNNAIKGVIIGVALIALWIYIRYNFAGDGLRYAVGGIVALLHDVLVLLGIFALIGHFFPSVEIDGAFIAALLTVVGYSINDSVVIFDRLRENLRVRRKEPFNKVVNDSLLETMSRSINTGLTVIIMLFMLLLFGGESIFNFVLAMLIGIVSGLYSSIFNASMVLVAWHNWDEKKRLSARPVATRRPSTAGAGAGGAATLSGAGAATVTRPSATPSRATSGETPVERPTASAEFVEDTSETNVGAVQSGGAARAVRKSRSKRRF